MLSTDALARLRGRLRVRFNWFLAALLGPEILSKEDLTAVVELKALPDREISLTERSFLLGRLKLLMKKKEWAAVDLKELMRASKEMTPLERLAIADARQNAAQHIRGLEADIADGLFTGIQVANAKVLTQATVQGAIQDEVALAVLYKKNYEKLAVDMTKRLGVVLTPRWKKISRTELHRAKVAGGVQAIVNKVGPLKHLDGANTKVSIVCDPGHCPDCAKHYRDADGNPKVFVLKDLIAEGTNADGSVSHKKKDGIHIHWKTVLPPAHPNCTGNVVPVPPGMGWVSGKLVALDIRKAFGTADTSISGTADTAVAAPAAIPGIAAPQQATQQPKSPSPEGGDDSAGGPKENMVDCIFGGGQDCQDNGGPEGGALTHKAGGEAVKKHQAAKAAGKAPTTPEGEAQAGQDEAQAKMAAEAYDKESHPHHETLNHLANSAIVSKNPLGVEQKGIQDTFKAAHAGGGHSLMKPEFTKDNIAAGTAVGDGVYTTPLGQGPKAEKSAYGLHMALGLTSHVPPTVTRWVDGKEHSMQEWQDGFHSAKAWFSSEGSDEAKKGNIVDHAIKCTPPSMQAALIEKLCEGSVMAIVMNHNDQHGNNIMYNPDTHDVRFIDNTSTMANSMVGHKNTILRCMRNLGRKVVVPDALMDKFSKTSLGDLQRAMPDMTDWQAGQTFLRMQYVMHLQKTEGHIDPSKFRSSMAAPDGQVVSRDELHMGEWLKNRKEQREAQEKESASPFPDREGYEGPGRDIEGDNASMEAYIRRNSDWEKGEFERAQERGELPSQLFDSFSKGWISAHAHSDNSPYQAEAEKLADIGVFMPASFEAMKSPAAYRLSGAHREYAKQINSTKIYPTREEMIAHRNEFLSDNVPSRNSPPVGDEEEDSYGAASTGGGTAGAVPRRMKKSLYIKNSLLTKNKYGLS